MIPKITDTDLKKAADKFQDTNEIEEFRNSAGMWIMENARIRYKLEDDEISELFITFHSKAKSCIEYFTGRGYTDLPAFMSVYTKHLVFNIIRKRRLLYTEEYLQLWQEEKVNENTEELIHHYSIDAIQKSLKEVSAIGKIIISLRFNLEMSANDLQILYKYLQKQNKPIINFHKEYENRILKLREKREALMVNLNHCNRKIYNSNVYPLSAKKRKKKLLSRLQNTHIIYSIKEMGELLSMSRHQAGRLYRSSLEIMKEKIKQEEARMQWAA